ncbi:MAG: hypothetical protein ACYCSN_18855 [Acidobacteriaceae bacterium]
MKKLSLDELQSKFNPDQEVEHLRAQVEALEKSLKKERLATGEARLNAIQLTEAIREATPSKMVYAPSKADKKTPITCVLHLTDLHNGEITKKDEVDGFGEFNPEIFTQRLQRLGERLIEFVNVQRSGYNIPHLHILGTGDYVSGDIHEELKVTNAYPAPVQAVRAGYDLGALTAMLAPHFETVTTDWITSDNHGRLTRKNQAAEGGLNNWGYVVAHASARHVSALPNVKVNIHAKPSALVRIGSERYLCFHGHEIKGWAGIPYYGFDRRAAMEAVKRMGVADAAFTKMVFGHFHVAVNTLLYNSGGSLSGTNTFDHASGRHARAHQTSWLVHPEHGEFGFTRWWLS